jgi:ribosomal protein S25
LFKQGSLEDHASLVEAVKKVDVVISTVGSLQIESQVNIIKAIKEVGTIKVHTIYTIVEPNQILISVAWRGIKTLSGEGFNLCFNFMINPMD